jgi:CubicO group peptidase (beta-lactamase class C family)
MKYPKSYSTGTMIRQSLVAIALIVSLFACQQPRKLQARSKSNANAQTAAYYPAAGEAWSRKKPEQVGMNADLLQQAVDFALQQETQQMPRDFSTQEEIFGSILGPVPSDRATTNGIVLRHGYIVAEWGDTQRPDPTYSVAKSVLSTLVGLTIDRGLIKDVHDPVAQYIHEWRLRFAA